MKIRLLVILISFLTLSACTEYSCPTYGSSYVYTPSKKKSFKFSKSKPKKAVKRAEQ